MREARTLTDEVQALIVANLLTGLPRTRAAALAGVQPDTFLSWMRAAMRDDAAPELRAFALAVEKAEAEHQRSILSPVNEVLALQPKLAIQFLGRRYPQDWGRRDNVTPAQTSENRDEETGNLRQKLLDRLERLLGMGTVDEAPPPRSLAAGEPEPEPDDLDDEDP